jgi:fibrillarin-like rRNA methylase
MFKKSPMGEQIRDIANRLQQETEVQIKATSRILGAAAQISENYDRLINEVVEMVTEDIDRQTQTVEILKEKFKTLQQAKEFLKIKATSWKSLANKLNQELPQSIEIGKNELSQPNLEKITVTLEVDVAEFFPNSQAVNEALRFLIRVTNKKINK